MSATGGITEGKSHKEGGIPMEVKSTGQKVELEGGEGVINKRNMASDKKFEFQGKQMTTCEIASEINSANGNGVQIDCDNVTGKKYEYATGGKILDEEQESSFKEWMDDGNVVEFEDGVYATQDAQYRNRLKGMDELRKYFRKEFLSDSYGKGGGVFKFPKAIERRINEINELLPKVNDADEIAGGYFGGTHYTYVQLTKPIEIKGKYVYIHSANGRYDMTFEKRYNVNDLENDISGRKGLQYDLSNILKAFKSVLKEKFEDGGWILYDEDSERKLGEYKTESEARKNLYEYEGNANIMQKSEWDKLPPNPNRHSPAFYFEGGGNIEWSKAEIGDSARVKSENKMGLIIKDYGRKFHLKFADDTEKTYDASELDFYRLDDEEEEFEGGGDVRDFEWYQMWKQDQVKKGTEHEMEHKDTIEEFKKEGVSDEEVAKAIAEDHLDEDENYYIELDEMESRRKLSQAINEFEKHRGYRKNAHKFKHGGYTGEQREIVHVIFTEDYLGVVRDKTGHYIGETKFLKDSLHKFTFLANDGVATALEFANTGNYVLVPNEVLNVVGFDERKYGKGGGIESYQSVGLNENDKQILKLLTKFEDPMSLSSYNKEKLSSFKGNNVVNELSSSIIQKIYGLLFEYHNVEHPIKKLYLSNVGAGNILSFAPKYLEKTMISFEEQNKYVNVEKEINSIINSNKEYVLLDNVELRDMDAIIHVYEQTNPEYEQLNYLLYQTNKSSIALGVCEFTSRERLNEFQRKIVTNQGAFSQNQMILYKEGNKYLIVNEGITEEGDYTLIYVLNKMY